jgi:hypothetical protein
VRRPPPKSERRAFLRERGWQRIGRSGSETWTHDRYGGRRFFTLAAAYRCELDPDGWEARRENGAPPRSQRRGRDAGSRSDLVLREARAA